MKKTLLIVFFVLLFAVQFVRADASLTSDISSVVSDVVKSISTALEPLFKTLLNADSGENDVFLIRILMLIIVFIISFSALNAFPAFTGKRAITSIIAICVAILSVRFLIDADLIRALLLPYKTLGIVLTSILPFIIFFYFVHSAKFDGLGRRLAWMFFGVVFLLLLWTKYSEMPVLGRRIYLGVLGLMVFAFVFDKGIHRYFFMHELNMFYKGAKSKAVASLQAEYLNIINLDTPQAKSRRDEIEKKLKELGADIP